MHCNDYSQECGVVCYGDYLCRGGLCGDDDDQKCDGPLADGGVYKKVNESNAEDFETMSDVFSNS